VARVSIQPLTSELARSFKLDTEQGALVASVIDGRRPRRQGFGPET
jgi:S1-C subfamily serine protease